MRPLVGRWSPPLLLAVALGPSLPVFSHPNGALSGNATARTPRLLTFRQIAANYGGSHTVGQIPGLSHRFRGVPGRCFGRCFCVWLGIRFKTDKAILESRPNLPDDDCSGLTQAKLYLSQGENSIKILRSGKEKNKLLF